MVIRSTLALLAAVVVCGCTPPTDALWLEPGQEPPLILPVLGDRPAGAAQEPAVGEPAEADDPRLTLQEAIDLALADNRGLATSRDSRESSRLSLVTAESAFELKVFPSGNAGASGTDLDDGTERFSGGVELRKRFTTGTSVGVRPEVSIFDNTFTTEVNLNVIQPLLRGSDREFNLSGVHSAEFGVRSSDRSLYLAQVNLIVRTVSAMYEVARQQELIRLNHESVDRLRGFAEAARAKEAAGLASPIETYRATIQLKSAEDGLIAAEESYQDALDSLRIILALSQDAPVTVNAPLTFDLLKIDETEAIDIALRHRVELEQAADNIAQAQRRSRIARHTTLPDLDLSLNTTQFGTNSNFADSTRLDETRWNLSVTTSTDLARTAERAAYAQSLLTVKTATRNMSLRRDEVVREVKRELRNLQRSEKQVRLQEEQIRSAEGQLELARVKFRRGLADNFDLIEAETQLRRAQTGLVSSVINYIVGTYRLRAGLGKLVER
ncbi:MAG: TolC family protein [Phycisphaerae bacterium]|nr:TolC family protein [Phycisphaerae bacterium]